MAGVAMVLLGAGGGAGGGGASLGALSWGAITGSLAGSNSALTISGIGGPHSLEATLSGIAASLSYTLNGTFAAYTGPFAVSDGDTLGWTVAVEGKATRSGTVTVTDATSGGALVDVFSYVVVGSGFQ